MTTLDDYADWEAWQRQQLVNHVAEKSNQLGLIMVIACSCICTGNSLPTSSSNSEMVSLCDSPAHTEGQVRGWETLQRPQLADPLGFREELPRGQWVTLKRDNVQEMLDFPSVA